MSKFQPNYIVLFMGAIFLGVGLFLIAPNIQKVRGWKPAQGHVVDVFKSMGIDGGQPDYAPIIDFTAADEQVYRFTSTMNTDKRPTMGAPESVLYDPAQPAHAIENSWFNIYGFPGIFLGVGAIILLVGLIFGGKFE